MPSDPADILAFWRAAGPDKWFEKNDAFDGEIRERFRDTYAAGAAGRLAAWEEDAEGALALVIVLDQFPRNMFRGDARTYAADPLARAVAERSIARGFDQRYAPAERQFFYLPLMHSEDLVDQERCLALCRAAGDEEGVKRPSKLKPLVVALGALREPESIGCDRSGQITLP